MLGLRSKVEIAEALTLFRRARELDPALSAALAMESMCHSATLVFQWSDDPDASVAGALAAAETSVMLAEDEPWSHLALGYAASFAGNPERALAAFERAIELNPSLTMAYQGLAVALSEQHPDEAIRTMEKAIRLSPRDPQMHLFLHQIAVAHLLAGRYEEALARGRESLRLRADQPNPYRIVAAACGHLGRDAEALEALANMQRASPHFSLAQFRRANSRALVERCLEGWRRAGWKEG